MKRGTNPVPSDLNVILKCHFFAQMIEVSALFLNNLLNIKQTCDVFLKINLKSNLSDGTKFSTVFLFYFFALKV